MTQRYTFLGTFEPLGVEPELIAQLQHAGWLVSQQSAEEWLLQKAPVTAYIETGQPWLINGAFKGQPADIEVLLADIASLSHCYAIDMFGDAARLVRRCLSES